MNTGQILAEILFGGEMKIHLIGVAGSGMSGIAGLLLAMGHSVSGSDRVSTVEVERLRNLGLDFRTPHDPASIMPADLVIYSSAVRAGNVEYDEAIRSAKSMVRRADALAAIMNCKRGIVVAGMHGKTTTSAMAAHVLRRGGLQPSHYVGAEIPILGTNAHWDPNGEYFVAEGDESDGTLANYHCEHAIVLNIEEEHLDYYDDLAAIEAVFNQLLAQTRGMIFFCADDPPATRLCAHLPRTVSFGESAAAHYQFRNLEMRNFCSRFDVFRSGECIGSVTLNVPGRHNVSNAMSVVALATELRIEFSTVAGALESFRGARRRFEIKHRSEYCMIVDDYAHHPSEIKATLATARAGGTNRIIALFQPHRYSRTRALKDEFGKAFGDATIVLLADIYPAGENPIAGVSSQTIVDAVTQSGHQGARYIPDRRQLLIETGRLLEPGDLFITLGAGNIHEEGARLAADVAQLEALRDAMGPGVLKLYEPLAKHTTLRVGGPAQFWAEPETEAGFARMVKYCTQHQLPLVVIGRGSNLLIRDGGIRGVVAHLARGEFRQLEVNGNQINASVGIKLKEVSYAARDAQLAGFEWMEGIPGNVGGSLRMNAGAMGSETFNHVVCVRYIDGDGAFHRATPAELDVRYRSAGNLKGNFAISALFEGEPGDAAQIARLLEDSMHKRRTTQPKESSAGCIFKNPGPCPAGKLVEELGLKDLAVGKARVSQVHGNFIVNEGGATARDVLELIERIKETARRERGIELETEVQIVGEMEEEKTCGIIS